MSQLILILQAFRHFTYVTGHSPTLPSLYLRHNSFSNPSVASPTSQLILQSFFHLSYVTGFSLTSPGEPPMPLVARAKSRSWMIQWFSTWSIFGVLLNLINVLLQLRNVFRLWNMFAFTLADDKNNTLVTLWCDTLIKFVTSVQLCRKHTNLYNFADVRGTVPDVSMCSTWKSVEKYFPVCFPR